MFSTVTVTLVLVAIATAWALNKLARMSVPLETPDNTRR
jgi:hypothetical protein